MFTRSDIELRMWDDYETGDTVAVATTRLAVAVVIPDDVPGSDAVEMQTRVERAKEQALAALLADPARYVVPAGSKPMRLQYDSERALHASEVKAAE